MLISQCLLSKLCLKMLPFILITRFITNKYIKVFLEENKILTSLLHVYIQKLNYNFISRKQPLRAITSTTIDPIIFTNVNCTMYAGKH